MADQDTPPSGVNVKTPNSARMYDYFLGGKDNFAIDRQVADEVIAALPEVPQSARENRAFLQRAVRYCVEEAGIRQFLDIGAGLPTQENVHQVAQRIDPDTRVVYVDHDPVVIAHARMLLDGVAGATALQADLRHPEEILDTADVAAYLDFAQPVAVPLVAIMHFIPDADGPAGIIGRIRDAIAPGSPLVLSHATADTLRPEDVEAGQQVSVRGREQFSFRSRAEVLRLFDGFDLVEPGLVRVSAWRPTDGGQRTAEAMAYGGVGRVGRVSRVPPRR